MIDILIIDREEQIKPELSAAQMNIQFVNDEVKALNEVEKYSSVVVLLHVNMMQEKTAEYIEVLSTANSNSAIAIVADELSDEEIVKCLLAGAKGYQQQSQLMEYASRLVNAMNEGEAWITRRMTATLLNSLRQDREGLGLW